MPTGEVKESRLRQEEKLTGSGAAKSVIQEGVIGPPPQPETMAIPENEQKEKWLGSSGKTQDNVWVAKPVRQVKGFSPFPMPAEVGVSENRGGGTIGSGVTGIAAKIETQTMAPSLTPSYGAQAGGQIMPKPETVFAADKDYMNVETKVTAPGTMGVGSNLPPKTITAKG